jgi:NADH:ubiquinone oxidoreductase subunit 2 (subunit N)
MISLKSNPSGLRTGRHDSRPYALQLKPVASVGDENVDRSLRLLPTTWTSRVAQVPFLARFAVINLIGVALLAAAWAEDLLLKPYRADESGMCYLITVLFVVGLVAVLRKDWQTVRWTGNTLVYLGMVGTVLGLIMTVSDLSVDKAQSFESFKAIIAAIYVGAGIALYTNLLACIGYLWLGTNAHLLARQEV